MCDEDPQKYISFIKSRFSKSRFLCFYAEDRLIGISVVDQFDGGISAVYTFFDPEESKRSLGTFAIMYMLKLAKLREISFVYLGYWIEKSSKMSYKSKFRPLQGYIDKRWLTLEE
jgi:arginine-tRNA-protein transferase